jgi:DNA-binding XRE family transcriptional regulator
MRTGARIKSRREKVGLSLRAVARCSGLSPGKLSKIERDIHEVSFADAVKLALALGVSVSLFVESWPHRPAPGVTGSGSLGVVLRRFRSHRFRHMLDEMIASSSVPVSTWLAVERDDIRPRLRIVAAMCRALEVSLDEVARLATDEPIPRQRKMKSGRKSGVKYPRRFRP